VRQWGIEGIALTDSNETDEGIEAIIPDGEGGCVIVWTTNNWEMGDDLWIERLNAAGEPQWGENGVVLAAELYNQHYADIVRHQEGFVVVWVDGRDDEENGQSQDDIYAQFIQPDGNFAWQENGYMVCFNEFHQYDPAVEIDNHENIWIVWSDLRSGGPPAPEKRDIYIQKLRHYVNESNEPYFLFDEREGIPVCGARGDQVEPKIVHDGRNGMYITWTDYRFGVWPDIYATHLRPDGSPYDGPTYTWDRWGDVICGATHKQNLPEIGLLQRQGGTGAVLVWEDKRATGKEELFNTFTQRIDDGSVSVPDIERPAHPIGYTLESIYPNPFNSQALITFVTPYEGMINITLYDVTGRLVTEISNEYWSAGRHIVLFDGIGFAAGTYIIRLDAGKIQLERRIQLLK